MRDAVYAPRQPAHDSDAGVRQVAGQLSRYLLPYTVGLRVPTTVTRTSSSGCRVPLT